MPVVTVTGPQHPAAGPLVAAVADAVARALGLGDGDVIAAHIASGATAVSGAAADTPWPIVTIQGSPRDTARMEAARAAASEAVGTWAASVGLPIGGVWTQWLTPMP